jgi:putative ABC transport system substrate-binding protein
MGCDTFAVGKPVAANLTGNRRLKGSPMVKRRDLIRLIGGAAAWPLATRAQQAGPLKRVAVLSTASEGDFRKRFALFHDRLAQLGWIEARNLRIDTRWTDGKPELGETYARLLLGLAPDVIFVEPGPLAEVVQRLTSTIPVVFITATDPAEAGYVQSYAHPGGNMTGFTVFEGSLNSKWLQLLKDVAPNVTRVGVLWTATAARARRDLETIEAAAHSLGATSVDLLVKDDAADIARVIDAFAREPNGGLIVPPSNAFYRHSELIVTLANRGRLPAIYSDRLYMPAGGLMSYGADRMDNFPRAADYVDRILRGAKPGDLPVQAPSKYELVLNLKTAKSLGLTISHEFLLIVDEAIE